MSSFWDEQRKRFEECRQQSLAMGCKPRAGGVDQLAGFPVVMVDDLEENRTFAFGEWPEPIKASFPIIEGD